MYNYLQSARFPSQWFLSALCAGRQDQIQSNEGTQRKARLNGTGDTHTRAHSGSKPAFGLCPVLKDNDLLFLCL